VEVYATPQYVFMAWCLVEHRDNFDFYLYLHPVNSSLLGSNILLSTAFKPPSISFLRVRAQDLHGTNQQVKLVLYILNFRLLHIKRYDKGF